MKKLAIFDLDGTLLNTIEDLHASTNFALKSEGLPERSLDEVRCFVGNGIHKLIERAVPDGCPPELTERVFGVFKRHYAENCMNLTRPYPGISELLARLKSDGWLLGVVSNKADAPAKALIAHYFPNVFDSVVGERENVRKKPAPDSVFETVRGLGCSIDDAVYIGDSDVDGRTAANAGCKSVLVSWGFRARETLLPFGCPIADSAIELENILSEVGK
jgi:phosphoglycolate phosphatase